MHRDIWRTTCLLVKEPGSIDALFAENANPRCIVTTTPQAMCRDPNRGCLSDNIPQTSND